MIHEIELLSKIIDQALTEDLDKEGDITSQTIFNKHIQAKAIIKSKESKLKLK